MQPSTDTEVYRGYFIGNFHMNHFYPEEGEGYWWMETDPATWSRVWDLAVGDPPAVTVYLEVDGELEPNVAKHIVSPEGDPITIPPRGATDTRLVVKQIRAIRPIPLADFNALAGVTD